MINVDYDARNRVIDVKYRVDADGGGYDYDMRVGWGYDEADRVDSITYPGGTNNTFGDTFNYVYDGRTGRPQKLEKSTGANVVSSVAWTPQGAPLTQKWGPGAGTVFRTWEYFDDSQRTHKIQSGTTAGAHGMANLHYRYTTDGLVEQRTDWHNSDQVECYQYDDLDRLTTAFTSDEDTGNPDDCSDGYVNVGQGGYDHTYGYNAIGNLTSVDGANWSYGAGSAGPHALTAAPGASFSYDDTGRQSSRTIDTVTTTLGWTPTGMTDTLTTGSDVTTYTYTADGEQVAREDPDTTITLRVADLWETDGTTTKQYLSFAGVPVAVDVETTGTERTWLISDLLGSNSVLHNTTSGNVRVWYDPWGVERAATGAAVTDYGYTGQHAEPTGLIDYNARQYDPEHKTFTAADPIIPDPANPQTLNRYAYVNNNPTNYTDPTGHYYEGSTSPTWCRSCPEMWAFRNAHGYSAYYRDPYEVRRSDYQFETTPANPDSGYEGLGVEALAILLDAVEAASAQAVADDVIKRLSVEIGTLNLVTGELCLSVTICRITATSEVRRVLAFDVTALPRALRDALTPHLLDRVAKVAGRAGLAVAIIGEIPQVIDGYQIAGWQGAVYESFRSGASISAGLMGAAVGGSYGSRFGFWGAAGGAALGGFAGGFGGEVAFNYVEGLWNG